MCVCVCVKSIYNKTDTTGGSLIPSLATTAETATGATGGGSVSLPFIAIAHTTTDSIFNEIGAEIPNSLSTTAFPLPHACAPCSAFVESSSSTASTITTTTTAKVVNNTDKRHHFVDVSNKSVPDSGGGVVTTKKFKRSRRHRTAYTTRRRWRIRRDPTNIIMPEDTCCVQYVRCLQTETHIWIHLFGRYAHKECC